MKILDKNLYKDAINTFGVVAQINVAMEECSELIKELSKVIRQKGNPVKISEEIADVQIMLEQLKIAFNNESAVDMWILNKNCRLADLIEKANKKDSDNKGVKIE